MRSFLGGKRCQIEDVSKKKDQKRVKNVTYLLTMRAFPEGMLEEQGGCLGGTGTESELCQNRKLETELCTVI